MCASANAIIIVYATYVRTPFLLEILNVTPNSDANFKKTHTIIMELLSSDTILSDHCPSLHICSLCVLNLIVLSFFRARNHWIRLYYWNASGTSKKSEAKQYLSGDKIIECAFWKWSRRCFSLSNIEIYWLELRMTEICISLPSSFQSTSSRLWHFQ